MMWVAKVKPPGEAWRKALDEKPECWTGQYSEYVSADLVEALADALTVIRDAHPTGLSWSLMSDGTWREACRDFQRRARAALSAWEKARGVAK